MATDFQKGLAYGVAGLLLLCPDGLLIRIVPVDQPTFIAARCLFTVPAMLCMSLAFGTLRPPAGPARWASACYGALFALGSIMFVKSAQGTELANTLVIIAAGPLLAAVLAAAVLKEKVPAHTWAACALALLAAVLVFSTAPSAQFAGGSDGRWFAVVNVVAFAGSVVLIRKFAATDIILGAAAGVGVAGLLYLPAADFAGLAPAVWLQLFVGGFVVQGVSFWLINRSARLLSPPEVSLLFLLELIIAPWLLWLAVGELPSAQTVIAGMIMVCAFFMNLYFNVRRGRPAR